MQNRIDKGKDRAVQESPSPPQKRKRKPEVVVKNKQQKRTQDETDEAALSKSAQENVVCGMMYSMLVMLLMLFISERVPLRTDHHHCRLPGWNLPLPVPPCQVGPGRLKFLLQRGTSKSLQWRAGSTCSKQSETLGEQPTCLSQSFPFSV